MKLFFIQTRSDRSPKNRSEKTIQESIRDRFHRTFVPEKEINDFVNLINKIMVGVNLNNRQCHNLTLSIQRRGGIHEYNEIFLWIQNEDLAVVTISLIECKKGTYLRYIQNADTVNGKL